MQNFDSYANFKSISSLRFKSFQSCEGTLRNATIAHSITTAITNANDSFYFILCFLEWVPSSNMRRSYLLM